MCAVVSLYGPALAEKLDRKVYIQVEQSTSSLALWQRYAGGAGGAGGEIESDDE
mgnify:CR=1 FL=1